MNLEEIERKKYKSKRRKWILSIMLIMIVSIGYIQINMSDIALAENINQNGEITDARSGASENINSDPTLIKTYQNNEDILNTHSFVDDALRSLGIGIINITVYLADACKELFNTCFGFIDVTTSASINSFIKEFKGIMIIVMTCAVFAIGALMLVGEMTKPKKIARNILITFVIVGGSTALFTQMNSFLITFKDGVLTSVENPVYQTINNNMVDLVNLDIQNDGLENVNFKENSSSCYGAHISNKQDYSYLKYNLVLNYDSAQFTWHGKTKSILKNEIVVTPTKEGKNVYTTRELFNGFGWNSDDDADMGNEFYYRYHIDYLSCELQLIALVIIFLSLSYKAVRLIYEVIVTRMLLYVSAGDIASGKKTKDLVLCIRDTYITLCVCVVSIKLYTLMNKAVNDFNITGLTKGIILLFIAFAVIDGPNIVQRMFGYDAGLSTSWAKIMTGINQGRQLLRAGLNAKDKIKNAPGKLSKKGKDMVDKINPYTDSKKASKDKMNDKDGKQKQVSSKDKMNAKMGEDKAQNKKDKMNIGKAENGNNKDTINDNKDALNESLKGDVGDINEDSENKVTGSKDALNESLNGASEPQKVFSIDKSNVSNSNKKVGNTESISTKNKNIDKTNLDSGKKRRNIKKNTTTLEKPQKKETKSKYIVDGKPTNKI